MNLSTAFFLLLIAVFAAASARAPKQPKPEPGTLHTKQRRWLVDDLKAYHQQMRKTHKVKKKVVEWVVEDYVPTYPDAPVLVQLSIGTPAVEYRVSMETGSEATFVLAYWYPGLRSNQSSFDPDQSYTAQWAGDYHAFSGELEAFGSAYDDVVGIFGLPKNTTQRFGVVDEIDDHYSYHPQMPDGVLGLSWDPADAANPNKNSSTIINLFTEWGWDRYWCQWLEVSTDPQHGTRESTGLTRFGGCFPDYCEAPAAENTYPLIWLEDTRLLAFTVDSFTYKSEHFFGGYGKVDTGVPNVLMPYDSFTAIYDDVNPTFDYDYFIYTVPCDQQKTLPDWVFTIGGNKHRIPSSSYVVDLLLPNNQCALSTYQSETSETTDFVFGYVFHNHWCIKMDIDAQAISILDLLD